jgi:CDP-glucose 4,6-dehydratase
MNEFWQGRRVLITGTTGLVGTWLAKSLIEKHSFVVSLVRDWDPQSEFVRSGAISKTNVVNGALEDGTSVERAIIEYEIDTIFHLGAQTIVKTALCNPLATFESNIRGTYQLLEACRKNKSIVKRIVIASSDKAYGSSPILPYTENMPFNAEHPYDVSKSCADLISFSYFKTYDLPIVIARCGNIFGGGDLNWSRIVPGTIKSFFTGSSPEIRSDGTFTRDYVFVQDVVNAYLTLASSLEQAQVRGGAFNFGPNRPYSVLEIVRTIQKIMGREDLEPIILNHAKAEIQHQSLSSQKAERILGWKPTYSLEEGLVETVNWYTNYLESLKENLCYL